MNIKNRIPVIYIIIFLTILPGILIINSAGCSKNKEDHPMLGERGKGDIESHTLPVLEPIEGFAVYENKDFTLRIQYPGNWEKKEGDNGVAFIIPGKNTDNGAYNGCNLLFEKMHGLKLSLEKYIEVTLEGMKKYMPGFKLLTSSEYTLGGHPAYQMTYTASQETIDMKSMSIFTIRNDKVYALSFNALPGDFETNQDTYKKITGSFQFLD
jgi:hypothetical protein